MLYNLFENRDFVSVFAVALLAEGVDRNTNHRCDFISSDREAAAFVMALDELSHKRNAPEMVPSVQQLDFESIAANLLA